MNFQNSPPFERSACFYVTISESFERFQNKFSGKRKPSSKNWSTVFQLKPLRLKTSFPFKTALSETNVKTNRMATTKWTYHKEWSFASNYFIFLENFFQFQNLLKRVNLMYQQPKCPYSYFSLALEFNFRVLFPCEYP